MMGIRVDANAINNINNGAKTNDRYTEIDT